MRYIEYLLLLIATVALCVIAKQSLKPKTELQCVVKGIKTDAVTLGTDLGYCTRLINSIEYDVVYVSEEFAFYYAERYQLIDDDKLAHSIVSNAFSVLIHNFRGLTHE